MEITIEELKNVLNPNIIDIRSSYMYNKGKINNAININELDIINNPDKYLEKDKVYYIYCARGIRSMKVCKYLNSLGYRTKNIKGGYQEYIK